MDLKREVNSRVAIWSLIFVMFVNTVAVVWFMSKSDYKATEAYEWVQANRDLPLQVRVNAEQLREIKVVQNQLGQIQTTLGVITYRLSIDPPKRSP